MSLGLLIIGLEPAQANTAQSNAAQSNAAQSNAAQSNAALANPARSDAAQANAAPANPARSDAAQANAAPANSARSDAALANAALANAALANAAQANAAQANAAQTNTALANTALANTARSDADQALIGELKSYIQGISTLEADFIQQAANGALSTGKFFLNRPGLMRIDYDPPSQILMIAEDWRLIYYDGSIKQVTTIPLSQTPLSILLDEDAGLDDDVTVTNITDGPERLEVTLVRTASEDQGSVTLRLKKAPLRLASWMIIDPQGQRTEILLRNVKRGGDLKRSLFHWRDPQLFGWPKEE